MSKYDFLNNFSDKDITYSLYGLFLGDGTYRDGWIRTHHTNKQRFYVEWLEGLFKEAGLIVNSTYDYLINTQFGKYTYSEVRIKVPHRFYFETQNKCFDDNKHKIVSKYILDNINELGILIWFLDDGQWHVSFRNNRGKRFGYLNTQSFTYEENVLIKNMFKERFNIDLKIHTDKSGFEKYKERVYYRLYFNATNFQKLFDLLRPYLKYIPKEFYYKFNMQYVIGNVWNGKVLSDYYNLI